MTHASIQYPFSRRTLFRGLGVSMALPWLESLPVWGDEPAKSRGSEPPVRLACLFSGNGFHSREWWAKGEGAEMELGKVLEPLSPFREKLLFLRGLYKPKPSSAASIAARPATCSPAPIWPAAAKSAPASAAIRSSPSDCDGPDQGAEPRAGLRAVDRGHAQELLDGLQLAHLVELADHADAAGNLSGPGLRPAVPQRGRPGRQERARRRARRHDRPPRQGQPVRPAAARRVSVVGPRGRAADRPGGQGRVGCKAGGRRSPSPTCRAPPTACRRTSTSTCG